VSPINIVYIHNVVKVCFYVLVRESW